MAVGRLWALPLLMLVWVNVHGGFLVGFVLLAIYWFGAVWQWFRLKGDRFEDVLRKIRAGRAHPDADVYRSRERGSRHW